MPSLVDHDLHTLQSALRTAGFPPSHAVRILRTFYAQSGSIAPFADQIGPRLQNWLQAQYATPRSEIRQRHQSPDGTVKLLIALASGGSVESVLMPAHRPDRAAGCVSSQIGCAMGCSFCASTQGGLERNLDAGEIVEQFLHLRREAAAIGRRLTSLVFMGMGEPMHNLDNVIAAIRRIADPDLGGLGWRQVTVSTVGIVPGIDVLAYADLNVHLALSLHAPDDATRNRLVPMNRRYPVAEIMAAARRFGHCTGRIPTIEYCLLAGVNDSDAQADQLAELMSGFRAHVNLIPYNPIADASFARPTVERTKAFLHRLRDASVVSHLRETRGDQINAACGQLRNSAPIL
jgi:23S rRNA (adenine2503-C2)-methyltransferase